MGAPVPGVEVEVRGADGRARPERRVGRIFVRGPSVTRGYFGDPEATRAVLVDGWLDTGDLGFVAGGELYVCGRAKDVIIIRGANQAPEEFEECLEGLAGLRAGCAVALPLATPEGEALLVLAETTPAADATLAERIRARIAARTGVRPQRGRAPGAGHAAADLERQAAARRGAAPLPRRRAAAAGAGHPGPARRGGGALPPRARPRPPRPALTQPCILA